jgi:REP element-mobilizing transposase RayT
MGHKNKIFDEYNYFLTMTVVDWVDIFTRPVYKHIIVDSLRFCQKEKGLVLYSWCLMSNHLHLIAGAKEGFSLSDILRDFKKFTSKEIVKTIKTTNESREKWMLERFRSAGKDNSKIKEYKFWKDGNEAKELYSSKFIEQKLNYIHNNPVVGEIVSNPEDYLYSSARNYCNIPGLLQVELIV